MWREKMKDFMTEVNDGKNLESNKSLENELEILQNSTKLLWNSFQQKKTHIGAKFGMWADSLSVSTGYFRSPAPFSSWKGRMPEPWIFAGCWRVESRTKRGEMA